MSTHFFQICNIFVKISSCHTLKKFFLTFYLNFSLFYVIIDFIKPIKVFERRFYMYFGFDFYRDNSIEDLEDRIEKINDFLAARVSVECSHRHFGVFLLPPKNSTESLLNCAPYLAQNQSKNSYRLCIEFFEDSDKKIKPDLELVYDLGKTAELYKSMQIDTAAVSYLCAYPEHEEVCFFSGPESISILFKFSDNDPNIKRIKNHLEFLIPNISNKSM